jgi:hypothetical protein
MRDGKICSKVIKSKKEYLNARVLYCQTAKKRIKTKRTMKKNVERMHGIATKGNRSFRLPYKCSNVIRKRAFVGIKRHKHL